MPCRGLPPAADGDVGCIAPVCGLGYPIGQYTLSGTCGGGIPCEPHRGLALGLLPERRTNGRTDGVEAGRAATSFADGEAGGDSGFANWFTGSSRTGIRPGESGKP